MNFKDENSKLSLIMYFLRKYSEVSGEGRGNESISLSESYNQGHFVSNKSDLVHENMISKEEHMNDPNLVQVQSRDTHINSVASLDNCKKGMENIVSEIKKEYSKSTSDHEVSDSDFGNSIFKQFFLKYDDDTLSDVAKNLKLETLCDDNINKYQSSVINYFRDILIKLETQKGRDFILKDKLLTFILKDVNLESLMKNEFDSGFFVVLMDIKSFTLNEILNFRNLDVMRIISENSSCFLLSDMINIRKRIENDSFFTPVTYFVIEIVDFFSDTNRVYGRSAFYHHIYREILRQSKKDTINDTYIFNLICVFERVLLFSYIKIMNMKGQTYDDDIFLLASSDNESDVFIDALVSVYMKNSNNDSYIKNIIFSIFTLMCVYVNEKSYGFVLRNIKKIFTLTSNSNIHFWRFIATCESKSNGKRRIIEGFLDKYSEFEDNLVFRSYVKCSFDCLECFIYVLRGKLDKYVFNNTLNDQDFVDFIEKNSMLSELDGYFSVLSYFASDIPLLFLKKVEEWVGKITNLSSDIDLFYLLLFNYIILNKYYCDKIQYLTYNNHYDIISYVYKLCCSDTYGDYSRLLKLLCAITIYNIIKVYHNIIDDVNVEELMFDFYQKNVKNFDNIYLIHFYMSSLKILLENHALPRLIPYYFEQYLFNKNFSNTDQSLEILTLISQRMSHYIDDIRSFIIIISIQKYIDSLKNDEIIELKNLIKLFYKGINEEEGIFNNSYFKEEDIKYLDKLKIWLSYANRDVPRLKEPKPEPEHSPKRLMYIPFLFQDEKKDVVRDNLFATIYVSSKDKRVSDVLLIEDDLTPMHIEKIYDETGVTCKFTLKLNVFQKLSIKTSTNEKSIDIQVKKALDNKQSHECDIKVEEITDKSNYKKLLNLVKNVNITFCIDSSNMKESLDSILYKNLIKALEESSTKIYSWPTMNQEGKGIDTYLFGLNDTWVKVDLNQLLSEDNKIEYESTNSVLLNWLPQGLVHKSLSKKRDRSFHVFMFLLLSKPEDINDLVQFLNSIDAKTPVLFIFVGLDETLENLQVKINDRYISRFIHIQSESLKDVNNIHENSKKILEHIQEDLSEFFLDTYKPANFELIKEKFVIKESMQNKEKFIHLIWKDKSCFKVIEDNFLLLNGLFDYYDVVSFEDMFSECTELKAIEFPKRFDTSKVTNMSYMFSECHNLTTIDISSFDTSNVTDMSYMFHKCSKLKKLDLSSLCTQNLQNITGMFHKCTNLNSINLTSFKDKDIELILNSSPLFSECDNLHTVLFSTYGCKEKELKEVTKNKAKPIEKKNYLA